LRFGNELGRPTLVYRVKNYAMGTTGEKGGKKVRGRNKREPKRKGGVEGWGGVGGREKKTNGVNR